MNVLIYADEGTSVECVKQTLFCLRSVLSPYYAVTTVTARQLLEEPWIPHTALLVVPGGADLPYCRLLNGKGNQKIKQYVRQGGKFFGICAGAYYGCARLEFEVGTDMEVSGPRELAFYNGAARGTTFKGFEYGSHAGARAVRTLTGLGQGDLFLYFNGGCLFEGDPEAEVLARFAGPVEMETEDKDPAAIVYKKYGKGSVVLSSVHIEYSMDESMQTMRDIEPEIVRKLDDSCSSRMALIRALLSDYLHLSVHENAEPLVPHVSSLYLTSLRGGEPSTRVLLEALKPMIAESNRLNDKGNVIKFLRHDGENRIGADADPAALSVIVFDGVLPAPRETPFFNHQVYFHSLAEAIEREGTVSSSKLGSLLLYGEVVTSTHTILESNSQFLKSCPHGLVFHGTRQTAGRGRGSNVWVNPPGVMALSGVYRVPQGQPVQSLVFVQYLVALALTASVKELSPVDIGLRLKWPNDVYIADEKGQYLKIGGIMVTCNVFKGEYVMVYSCGANVDNSQPTTSINSRLVELGAPPIQLEKLLATMVTKLDKMMHQFIIAGFRQFLKPYYAAWLHSGARVTLERYEGLEATIVGISPDSGMLIVEDAYGTSHELQPDGNSFDMLRGLIKAKK